jgi:hypothetical protein
MHLIEEINNTAITVCGSGSMDAWQMIISDWLFDFTNDEIRIEDYYYYWLERD